MASLVIKILMNSTCKKNTYGQVILAACLKLLIREDHTGLGVYPEAPVAAPALNAIVDVGVGSHVGVLGQDAVQRTHRRRRRALWKSHAVHAVGELWLLVVEIGDSDDDPGCGGLLGVAIVCYRHLKEVKRRGQCGSCFKK